MSKKYSPIRQVRVVRGTGRGLSQRTIFGPPPHSLTIYSHKICYLFFIILRVRFNSFLVRAVRLGRARGPSAAARKNLRESTIFNEINVYLWLGKAHFWADRCG